jgi:hypothetical protein
MIRKCAALFLCLLFDITPVRVACTDLRKRTPPANQRPETFDSGLPGLIQDVFNRSPDLLLIRFDCHTSLQAHPATLEYRDETFVDMYVDIEYISVGCACAVFAARTSASCDMYLQAHVRCSASAEEATKKLLVAGARDVVVQLSFPDLVETANRTPATTTPIPASQKVQSCGAEARSGIEYRIMAAVGLASKRPRLAIYRRRVLVADQFPLPDPILQVVCGGGGGAQIGREGLSRLLYICSFLHAGVVKVVELQEHRQ